MQTLCTANNAAVPTTDADTTIAPAAGRAAVRTVPPRPAPAIRRACADRPGETERDGDDAEHVPAERRENEGARRQDAK